MTGWALNFLKMIFAVSLHKNVLKSLTASELKSG